MDGSDRLLVPYGEAMRQLGGLGKTKFFQLVEGGEIERVRIGRRGFVTARSIEAYVQRLSATASAR
jgi:hypothetical protein